MIEFRKYQRSHLWKCKTIFVREKGVAYLWKQYIEYGYDLGILLISMGERIK